MKRKLLVVCLAVASLLAQGQESEVGGQGATTTTDSLTINIAEAIEIAISENATIKVADTEIARQLYVKRETTGNLLPNLSASGTYMYNIMNSVMFLPDGIFGEGTGGAMEMGFANSYTGAISLSLPLVAPTVWASMKLNKEQMLQAVEQARSSKIELANSVKKSYYALLLTQSSLQLIEENISLAQDVVDDSQAAFDQGFVSEYDLITSQVQLSNLTPTLIEAQSAEYNARLLLNMLLGLPLETPLKVEEELISFVDFIENNDTHEIDLSGNADLNLLDIQMNLLEGQLKIQKTIRMPSLSAFGEYQILTQSDSFDLSSYDWVGTAYVGLSLNIPIFSGLTNINKERQIENQQIQLELQRDYLEESLNVEAQAAVSNIKSANKQMAANLIAKEQAQKGYSIAVTRYDTGVGTIVEVNQAQLHLIQADMNYRQSIYNYMVAQADYDKTIGTDF